MKRGNILMPQKIQGHTTLAMTMRYTHVASYHWQDAVKLGSIADYQHFLEVINPTS